VQCHAVSDDGRIFAARIFQTGTITVQWAWTYDDDGLRVALDCEDAIALPDQEALHVNGSHLTLISHADGHGRVEVSGANDGFAVEFDKGRRYSGSFGEAWEPRRHWWLPDLSSHVAHRGGSTRARSFAKRYTWEGNAPRYWAYRMFSGYVENAGVAVWSADALFDDTKHGNFNLLTIEGELWRGDPARTFHGDMRIGSSNGERKAALTLRPLARAERVMRSQAMDSRLVQWPTEFTLADSFSGESCGRGVYEYVCGTLG
jgi:hypothetical protein